MRDEIPDVALLKLRENSLATSESRTKSGNGLYRIAHVRKKTGLSNPPPASQRTSQLMDLTKQAN
jgi:hypothetical protein